MSTMEGGFIAGAMSVSECGWIRQLLMEILHVVIVPSIIIDNQSAIRTMKNEMISTAAKHIALRYHFIEDEITKGLVNVKWCPSKDQLADILTKAVSRQTYEVLRCQLHVVNVSLKSRIHRGQGKCCRSTAAGKRYVDDISSWHHQIHLIDGMMTQGLRDSLLGRRGRLYLGLPRRQCSTEDTSAKGEERKCCMLVISVFS